MTMQRWMLCLFSGVEGWAMVQSCLPSLADSCRTAVSLPHSRHVLCQGCLRRGRGCWDGACGSKVRPVTC